METTISFGYWIRRQRKALDLTQQALADRVGCSLAAIKKIESDERRPSLQIAKRLADILGIPASQRDIFLEIARGVRSIDQLLLAHEPAVSLPSTQPDTPKSPRHNLPAQLTTFIGRERELAELKKLLSNTRLLTLTGSGGTGKTRLSLQLAAEILDTKQFPSGVWLVELAPLADPALVTQTVASTLGVREQPRRSLSDALMDYVRGKAMLLILDNCEHLIEACAQIADSLLRVAPLLKIVASSREPLGIIGETVYRVPSLPLPDPGQIQDLDAFAQNDCVHLFVDRALATSPHFRLKENNAFAIADICRRLDGIPLAIELASARIKVFPPEEIAARLDDRFRLLTGGSRTALERHQTLFALIEWSHNLLSEAERVFLRRLSVFAGGWSFQAAQAVCGKGIDVEMLDLLTHLVDKSLVVTEEETEEARYRLPETIRQYARDKLLESGEAEKVRDRHLQFYVGFAETAEPKLRSAEQLEWLSRVETEHDNLRTALAWSLESSKSETTLELAGALYYFWLLRGYWSEGQKWLDEALALSEREQRGSRGNEENRAAMARRAKVLYSAGQVRFAAISNPTISRRMVEESLRLWRELGDKWWIAVALEHVGFMLIVEGDVETARARLEEGVSLARTVEDRWPLATCLVRLAGLSMRTDLVMAHRLLEEGVAVARSVGDKSALCQGLLGLGSVYLMEGNLAASVSVDEEVLGEARAIGSILHVCFSLFGLVVKTSLQGDPTKSKAYGFELLALGREKGTPLALGLGLVAFGFVASFDRKPGPSVHLLAAAEAFGLQRGINLNLWGGPLLMIYRQALENAKAQLDPAAFEAAWAEGQQMTMEQALALATENESEVVQPPKGDG